MIPTLRTPCHRDGWAYEEKVDGWRILAYKDGQRVRLVKGVTHDGRFRELAAAIGRLAPATLVLDGEIAIFDEQLRSRFELLRHRDPGIVTAPPVLIAFDALYLDGQDVAPRPLRERRQLLEDLVTGADMVYSARRLVPNGLEAWAQVLERGYEGLVAKDDGSSYRGGKTTAWLKVRVAATRTVPSLVGAMATGTAAR
jgi:bifunctional non-homologous end joining protein LigD